MLIPFHFGGFDLPSWRDPADDPAAYSQVMMRRLAMACEGRVMFATHEGRDVGYIFGGMAGPIYRGQQFSFDDAWRDMSIGYVLQYEQIAWLCEEGAHRSDMGPLTGPFMEYKAHRTEIHLPMEAWFAN